MSCLTKFIMAPASRFICYDRLGLVCILQIQHGNLGWGVGDRFHAQVLMLSLKSVGRRFKSLVSTPPPTSSLPTNFRSQADLDSAWKVGSPTPLPQPPHPLTLGFRQIWTQHQKLLPHPQTHLVVRGDHVEPQIWGTLLIQDHTTDWEKHNSNTENYSLSMKMTPTTVCQT